jgi:hypothetical protein
MKRLPATTAACALALAAACSNSDETPDTAGSEAVESTTADLEGIVPEGYGTSVFESCDEDALTAAMAEVVTVAGVELVGADPSSASLMCTWDDGTETGPSGILYVYRTGSETMRDYLENSGHQEIIDDPRFEEIGVTPAISMGCEEGTFIGCAIIGYGPDSTIGLQTIDADAVTLDQMVDALWELTSAINDLADRSDRGAGLRACRGSPRRVRLGGSAPIRWAG